MTVISVVTNCYASTLQQPMMIAIASHKSDLYIDASSCHHDIAELSRWLVTIASYQSDLCGDTLLCHNVRAQVQLMIHCDSFTWSITPASHESDLYSNAHIITPQQVWWWVMRASSESELCSDTSLRHHMTACMCSRWSITIASYENDLCSDVSSWHHISTGEPMIHHYSFIWEWSLERRIIMPSLYSRFSQWSIANASFEGNLCSDTWSCHHISPGEPKLHHDSFTWEWSLQWQILTSSIMT